MSSRVSRVLALGTALLFGGCSSDSGAIVTGPAPGSVAVASVTVAPSTASISTGGTQQFTATLVDASGNTLTGRAVMWSTSDASIATVNSATGLVTGVSAGTATITATSEGKSGSATITATPVTNGTTTHTLTTNNIITLPATSPMTSVNVAAGSSVTVTVTGSIYYRDLSPELDDPIAGVLVLAITNGQDGSANESRVLQGTNYYKATGDSWSFQLNSGVTKIYLVALGGIVGATAGTLIGTYTVTINGVAHVLTSANVLELPSSSPMVAIDAPAGSAMSISVSGAIKAIDINPSQDDPLAGVLVIAATNGQDGSALEARVLQGTHFYKSAGDTWDFTLNSGTTRFYAGAVVGDVAGPVGMSGSYLLTVRR